MKLTLANKLNEKNVTLCVDTPIFDPGLVLGIPDDED